VSVLAVRVAIAHLRVAGFITTAGTEVEFRLDPKELYHGIIRRPGRPWVDGVNQKLSKAEICCIQLSLGSAYNAAIFQKELKKAYGRGRI